MFAVIHNHVSRLSWPSHCEAEAQYHNHGLLWCLYVCSYSGRLPDPGPGPHHTGIPSSPWAVCQPPRSTSHDRQRQRHLLSGADKTINELNLKLDQTQIKEHCLQGLQGVTRSSGSLDHREDLITKGLLSAWSRRTRKLWGTWWRQLVLPS